MGKQTKKHFDTSFDIKFYEQEILLCMCVCIEHICMSVYSTFVCILCHICIQKPEKKNSKYS